MLKCFLNIEDTYKLHVVTTVSRVLRSTEKVHDIFCLCHRGHKTRFLRAREILLNRRFAKILTLPGAQSWCSCRLLAPVAAGVHPVRGPARRRRHPVHGAAHPVHFCGALCLHRRRWCRRYRCCCCSCCCFRWCWCCCCCRACKCRRRPHGDLWRWSLPCVLNEFKSKIAASDPGSRKNKTCHNMVKVILGWFILPSLQTDGLSGSGITVTWPLPSLRVWSSHQIMLSTQHLTIVSSSPVSSSPSRRCED